MTKAERAKLETLVAEMETWGPENQNDANFFVPRDGVLDTILALQQLIADGEGDDGGTD